MPPRSPVRTNIVIFTILGFVVALLIHFIVLSSERYNWLTNINIVQSVAVEPVLMLMRGWLF